MNHFKGFFLISLFAFSSCMALTPDDYPEWGEKARFIDEATYTLERQGKPFFASIFEEPGDDEWMLTKIGRYHEGTVHLPPQPESYWGVFGPYVNIPGGLYLAEITLTSKPGASIGKIDLVQRGYSHIQGEKPFQIIVKTDLKLRLKTETFRFRFRIPKWKDKRFDTRFEFRFCSSGKEPVIVHTMTVYPAQSTFVPKAPKLVAPVEKSAPRITPTPPQNPLTQSDEQMAMILQAQEIADFRTQSAQTDLQQAMMKSQHEF